MKKKLLPLVTVVALVAMPVSQAMADPKATPPVANAGGRTDTPSQTAVSQISGNGTLGMSGFAEPFSGTPGFTRLAPTQIPNSRQLNQPLGQGAADRLAAQIGLRKSEVFTPEQYALFISGGGVNGELAPAELVDASVRILTNTVGRPLTGDSVLASYGLMVNTDGLLESPANSTAPTREVNSVLAPGGYMDTWCRENGATRSLINLYASAFTSEAVYGNAAQQQSGVAQLVTNTKRGTTSVVGMSMVPSIWIVNFALIYTLNPALAALMPAYWAPIPSVVAQAIYDSPTGQVPYSEYAQYLN